MVPTTIAVQTDGGDIEAWVSGEDAAIAAEELRTRRRIANALLPIELSPTLPARLFVLCEVGGVRVFAANGEIPYARWQRVVHAASLRRARRH
ncbi:hypothetical protein WT83_27550 [Burkholderia territorii]|uniref:Uncharacterized protein n=1 Tax=Burkholderia territorii TaxID=1503055 RepID=A0A108E839_9BURK|nr:hypothetical protein [Burkholderia territorii]KWN06440.1 hypothetical protein WT83_27550 [Burkholderia territorii]